MHKLRFFIISGVLILGIILVVFLLKNKNIDGSPADLAISNVTIVTMNEKHKIIQHGWIAINESKIVGLGEGQCCENFKPSKIIDGENKIITPAMINTHSHAAMILLKDQTSAQNLEPWLKEVTNKEENFSETDVYNGSLVAEKEMLNSGISLFNDMYFFPEQTIKASENSGIRAMVRIPVTKDENGLSYDENLFLKYKNNATVLFNLAPNPLENYSIEDLKWFSQEAKKLDIPIHIHLAEDLEADKILKQKFNLTPLQLLKTTNLINNKLIIAHGITFSKSDITELAKYQNISISINPISNNLLSHASAPLSDFLDAGINLGFGTDGSASSGGTLDLFTQMRFAGLNINCNSTKPFCINNKISSETLFSMATIGGAKALGVNTNLGSLEVGKDADLVLFNNLEGEENIYDKIIFKFSPANITNVFVAGKEIKK